MTNENNKVEVIGKIITPIYFSHEVKGERFYKFMFSMQRLSKIEDIIPVIVSQSILYEEEIRDGDTIEIDGEFRSFSELGDDGKFHLKLFIFVKRMQKRSYFEEDKNEICLRGNLCKMAIYRRTPLDREIVDLLIAVDRKYNKCDYIPCIAWGKNARYLEQFSVGTMIELKGRIQSREYIKSTEDGEYLQKTAYEISIQSFEITK